jgi:hypothetical protein
MARLVCVVWDDGYGTMPLLLPRTANSYPPPSSWNLTCLILELGHFFDLLELELELFFLIISFILHFLELESCFFLKFGGQPFTSVYLGESSPALSFFIPCFHLSGMASGCTPNETYVAPGSPFLALLL